MLQFFKDNVANGKKFSLIDSPVGTGKSFGAVLMADWYRRNVNNRAQFDVLTNSKVLQEQYTRDFEFMQSLWGKANYRCEQFETDCGTGRKLAKDMKIKCADCPYKEAKEAFFGSIMSLTNFHLFITYHVNIPHVWATERAAKILIIDEAHEFDAVFCDFITSKLSKHVLKRCGMDDAEATRIAKRFSKYQTIEAFAEATRSELVPMLLGLEQQAKADYREADEDDKKQVIATLDTIALNIQRWNTFIDEFAREPGNWVIEHGADQRGNPEVIVQPVWAWPYLEEYIWRKYDHVILMSGTILSKPLFCYMNGLSDEATAYVSIPSPFPKENRPVYYLPDVGKMSYKEKEVTFQRQHPFITRILNKHREQKGIIHTFSYENMNRVVDACANIATDVMGNPRLLHHDASTRNTVLERHLSTPQSTVLVSPSMMTGIDLKEDLSRFQIIMKIPYPNLSSEKVKKRKETRPDWYSWKTVCDMMQMYGRSIRSETDKADTYILDASFGDILRYSGHLLPNYVKEAITYVNTK